MKVHFDQTLKKLGSNAVKINFVNNKEQVDVFLCMSLWYATFYVLIEGWLCLKLSDDKIDALLKSKNVALLKTYRNGVFHFQKKYYDKRFIKLMKEGQDVANWIRDLRDEFSRWFLDVYKNNPKV